MMHPMRGCDVRFLVVVLTCLLAACSTGVQQVAVGTALTAPGDAGLKLVQFRKVTDAVLKGEPIGTSRFGILCIPGKPLAWRDGRVNLNDDELVDTFRQEIDKVRFATVVEAVAASDATASSRAGFVVSARLVSVHADMCAPGSDFGNWRDVRGGAYVKVQWQVYSGIQKKVVLETSSEGSYQVDESVSGGGAELVRAAFASATQNLLADEEFYRSIHGHRSVPAPKSTSVSGDPSQGMDSTKGDVGGGEPSSAIFTVIAGARRGSGFVVSPDGYLITSEQTVRGYQLVKLKSSAGRESLGFVVRRDEQNDVAVVQITDRNVPALPLRSFPTVASGEEVYLLGGAARMADAGVRKGVVGAQKDAIGSRLIKTTIRLFSVDAGAPVFDRAGKVVGVATASTAAIGAEPGSFVPIAEVLSRLAVSLK